MRIAILGTRGIPASYGGFETFAEELSTRLAARGHHVAVYCRARSEVAAWLDTDGPARLRAFVEAVATGTPFDQAAGRAPATR